MGWGVLSEGESPQSELGNLTITWAGLTSHRSDMSAVVYRDTSVTLHQFWFFVYLADLDFSSCGRES